MVDIQLKSSLEDLTFQNSNPFITISLPLNSENFEDPYKVLEELISDVKRQLFEVSDGSAFEGINKKLNKLKVKLPPQNLFKSLVALISEDQEEIIPLNVDVEKKAFVGSDFDMENIENLKSNSLNAAEPGEKEDSLSEVILNRYSLLQPFGKRTF